VTTFDVVIIGAGSAGCAFARRLCDRTSGSICLVEAGPDYGAALAGQWPAELLDARRLPSTHDWGYQVAGSAVREPRAKVIGGCSTHNQCGAFWGHPADYDAWAQAGNPGWTYTELRPLIDQVERASVGSTSRGRAGLVETHPCAVAELGSWHQTFFTAAQAAGFPVLADLSDPEAGEGVAPVHANITAGVRWNAAFAFLDAVRASPHLTILSGTLADTLRLEQGTAVELRCQSTHGPILLQAQQFVLCAGAYGSPALLLRSGIGPPDQLQALGIPVQLPLAGVGAHLQDHLGIEVTFAPSRSAQQALETDLAQGRFSQSQVVLRARSSWSQATCDLHVVPYLAPSETGGWRFQLLVFDLAPTSRGQVRLQGTDPALAPLIERPTAAQVSPHDWAVLAEGYHLIRRLASSPPLAAAIERELTPAEPDGEGEREPIAAILEPCLTTYGHPAGTCAMGPTAQTGAVVEPTGRVHRTTNVYVADASIMPHLPSAPPNLTCFLIGFHLANQLAQLVAAQRSAC
jgi:choline dehydrogenase